jgi:sugar phosphate isomerase/epimerase
MTKPGKIALQLYTLRQLAAEDLEGVLALAAEIGFIAVEPVDLYGMDPGRARAILDHLGLEVCSAHAPLPEGDAGRARMEQNAVLGATEVFCSLRPEDFASGESIQASAERFIAGASLAADHGIALGYHNHFWEFDHLVEGQLPYELFLAAVGDIALEIDLYWAQTGGVDAIELVRRLGGTVNHLHIKDGPCTVEADMVALGQGTMNIPAMLGASPARWHIVELDRCATDMVTAVRASYAYLVGNGLSEGRPTSPQ